MTRLPMSRLSMISWIGPGLVSLFVFPVLVYGIYSIGERWHQNYLLAQQEAAIRADLQRLRERNLELQRELEEAKSDTAIETVAREQLGLVKPGDRALQIVGPAGAVAPEPPARREPTPAATPTPVERPRWLRLLDAIFGR